MTSPSAMRRVHRQQLLGGAGAAFAFILAALPAHAQVAGGRTAGDRVLTNVQSAASGITLAQGNGVTIESVVTGPVDGATITLDDNAMTAKARSNSASQTLASDAADAPASRVTSLAAGASSIAAEANALIANRQSLGAAEAIADILLSPNSIATGEVSNGELALRDNSQAATAAGNAATAAIELTAAGSDGAGIVSTQTGGSGSGVAARVRRGLTIDTGTVAGSAIAISGNSNDADAAGNAVDNSLSVSGGSLIVPLGTGIGSTVPAIGEGDPSAGAMFAVLSNQRASGVVKSRAGNLLDGMLDGGPAILTTVDDADTATIVSDGNEVSATGHGNRSSNALSLSAADMAAGPAGSGAIGSVANVQGASDARIVVSAHGGVAVDVSGHFADSTMSISRNRRETTAAANAATGNWLEVEAASVGGSGTASALVHPEAGSLTDAGFGVHSVQDYGSSTVSIVQAGAAARATVDGDIDASTIALRGNGVSGTGIGNSAVNSADLQATTFGSSAAVNNVQSGNGSVTTELGTLADPGGVLIAPSSAITDSSLTVSGNATTGSAIGNAASNVLRVAAASLSGDGAPAVAGVVGGDYGATGSLVLASNQKLGQLSIDGSLTPTISSSVVSVDGVDGVGPVTGSRIDVEANGQRAAALANTVTNSLTGSAAGSEGASAALSSSQYGEANVSATSDFALGTRGDLTDSTATLSGNSNAALATINDAANALEIDTASRAAPPLGGFASAGPLGPPVATGAVALANQQFATGSALATAVSRIGDVEPDDSLAASTVTLEGNDTAAEAAGNRAANGLAAASGAGSPGASLANSQTNIAQVGAMALERAGFGMTAPAVAAVAGSSIGIEGNTTSALARGNAADNRMSVAAAGTPGADVGVDLRNMAVAGDRVLLNGQANYGAVTASTDGSGYLVPLNAMGTISGSSVMVGGNTIAASAYGNSAANSVTIPPAGSVAAVGIANFQANNGAITALVSGTGYQGLSGPLSGSAIRITGNSLAATAVGNQTTSAIAGPR